MRSPTGCLWSKRWVAERKEFVQTTRKKWWYYLPTIGYTLHAPSITANTGILAQIDYNRTQVCARLESMDARYQVEFVETLGKIRYEYQKLIVRYGQLELERLALKRLTGIARIHADAFNAQTMTPEESLRHAYEYDRAMNEFKNRGAELVLSVLEFHNLCRYQPGRRRGVPY